MIENDWTMVISPTAFEKLQKRLQDFEAELKTSRVEAQKTQKLFAQTIETNNGLTKKVSELEDKITSLSKERIQVTLENLQLKKKMEEVSKTVGEMRENCAASEQERQQLRQSVADLTQENVKLTQALKDLQQIIQQFSKEKVALSQGFEQKQTDYRKQIKTIESEKDQLEQQIKALQAQNDQVQIQIAQLQTEKQTVQDEKEDGETLVDQLQQDNETFKTQVKKLDAENQQAQAKIQALTAQVLQLLQCEGQLTKEKAEWLKTKSQLEHRITKGDLDKIKALQDQMSQTTQKVAEWNKRDQEIAEKFRAFGRIDLQDPEAFIEWFLTCAELVGLSEDERKEIGDNIIKYQPLPEDIEELKAQLERETKKGAWWKGMAKVELKAVISALATALILI